VSGTVRNKVASVLHFTCCVSMLEKRKGEWLISYLMSPSFSYSARILFSDISSLLVFFFLLREQVSLKLSRESEQKSKENMLLRFRGVK
jgi:hypothetical protein